MSDASVSYSVELSWITKGDPFSGLRSSGLAQVRDLERQYGFSGQRIGAMLATNIGNGLANVTDMAATAAVSTAKAFGAALAGGLAVATKHGIAFNRELENAKIGLATVASMNLGVDMSKGMAMSEKTIKAAMQDAKRLPGEFRDLMGFITSSSAPALQRGVSFERLEKISANAMAASAALAVSMPVAQRQLAMMFEGRLTRAQAFGLRLGFTPKEFNKLGDTERVNAIEKALAKANPAISVFERSFEGRLGTLKDTARQFSATMTAPLFASLTDTIGRGLAWADAHGDLLDGVAKRFGGELDHAFHRGIDLALHWGPIMLGAAKNFGKAIREEFDRVKPYLDKFAGLAERFMKNPNAPKNTLHGIEGILALRTGSKLLGPLIEGLGGGGVVGAAALAASLVVLAGAFDAVNRETAAFHGTALAAWNDIKARGGDALVHLSSHLERLAPLMIKVGDAAGTVFLVGMEGAVYAIDQIAKVLDAVGRAAESAYAPLAKYVDKLRGDHPKLNPESDIVDPMRKAFEYFGTPKAMSETYSAGDVFGTTPKVVNHHTTINNNNHFDIRSEADPNKIAVVVADKMKEWSRYPRSSSHSPNSSLYR